MLTVERAKQKLLWGGLIAFDMEDGFGVFEYSHEDNKLYVTFILKDKEYPVVYSHDNLDQLDNVVKELDLELYEVRQTEHGLEKVEESK